MDATLAVSRFLKGGGFLAPQSSRRSKANPTNLYSFWARGARISNARGDPSRVNTYPLKGYERIVNRLVQGGERFQAVTLTSPGSVTLRRVGIQPTFFFPHHSANRGYFRCNGEATLDFL